MIYTYDDIVNSTEEEYRFMYLSRKDIGKCITVADEDTGAVFGGVIRTKMMKGITLIEVIVGICIIGALILICVPVVSNHAHKIDHGEIVDKNYTAGYSSWRGKNGYKYNPEKFELTIKGEKNGKTVEYTFTVPETEYYMYNIGDDYPKERCGRSMKNDIF